MEQSIRIRISEDLKERFRDVCDKRNETMSDILLRLIKLYIIENTKRGGDKVK